MNCLLLTYPVSNSTTIVGRSSSPVPIFKLRACVAKPDTIPAASATKVP